MEKVNLAERFAKFSDHWSPKIVGTVDDYEIKLARLDGEFMWHSHAEADELFLVIEGDLKIELRDRVIDLGAGELFVVPKGVEHKPVAGADCKILLFERAGVVNTGDAAPGALTNPAEPL